MDFTSDNAAGVHPAILRAVADAAGPEPAGYDGDRFSARLDDAFSQLFERPVKAFAVPSGTAANALGLAAVTPPFGGVWCHAEAHIEVDEAGAIPFYTGGATLMLVPAPAGKLTVAALDEAAARRRGDVHQVQPAALSLTQATECGTVYRPDEVAALAQWAKARGLKVQMDGARFANAVRHLGCAPADVTWRAGVDLLSFGCIKNGGMSAEALIVFDEALAQSIPVRRKRAGLMPSKGRFAAAQLLAMLEGGLWLEIAAGSNAAAQRLAKAAAGRLLYPVEANELFLHLNEAERARLRAQGFSFYDWELAGPEAARFVIRWDQAETAIESLASALASL
ncbi:beta-eliminating lyase-related protein [Sandaracinobacter sp. RS1-74]|uniref:threonine aldolase family protein n=1 Tax=Sandaracinobacteroides sayramensis TaxID=2913411 RepID=UPI001ED9E575|nr:beta-eliminating lyase-related protein [Sandaracinobacteroides sayramensis]MCG2842156.1 beta-eliminating lyase-related protein [Sandaracinobacteroides sayramensis]